MSRIVDSKVGLLLDAAESEHSCLALPRPVDRALRRALDRRVENGRLVSPARGIYARPEYWDALEGNRSGQALHIMRGLQAIHPEWVFCGACAAAAWGIDVSNDLLKKVTIAATVQNRSKDTLDVEHLLTSTIDAVNLNGVKVTGLARTVSDCMRWSDFPHGLAIVDSALKSTSLSEAELTEFLDGSTSNLRGRAKAYEALAWADPASDNGGESIARGRMIENGYIAPHCQLPIPHPLEPNRTLRADYAWTRNDGSLLLGELDGNRKYTEDEFMGGRDIIEVIDDQSARESLILEFYNVSMVRFPFSITGNSLRFSMLLDSYGVPYRTGNGTRRSKLNPDWDALRKNRQCGFL